MEQKEAKALFAERQQMMDNVYAHKHNKRVMLGSNSYTWAIIDKGYKLNDALYDPKKLEEVTRYHQEQYGFDMHTDVQNRNCMRVTALLGGGRSRIDDEKNSLYVLDASYMEGDEYQEYAENPSEFLFKKVFRRYAKPELTMAELKVAIREWDLFTEGNTYRNEMLVKEYGCLLYFRTFPDAPLESLFGRYRGIKGLSVDLRKHKKELKEYCERHFQEYALPTLKTAIEGGRGYAANLSSDWTGYVAPINLSFLAYSVLNPKQFAEFYWPYNKYVIDECAKSGMRIYAHAEGTCLRFADFYDDIPKGMMMFHLEQDDPFEFRKRLPHIAIAGGMPCNLLGGASKEECVDYAKKLIDGLGDGFVLDQDKMMSYATDCKGENLKAVNDFARNYQY
ncbi:MAG: hypothetical protein E7240_10060 [Lachnospiraceae bacterium]|nr:hypothetical protein [Lachnospiraceae bacterium]